MSAAREIPPLSSADSLFFRADSLLATGDTSAAFLLLDRALELDGKHARSRLARGNLLLAAKKFNQAEAEFKYALFSDSDTLKSLAFMGLGDIEAARPKRNWEAIKQYRIASILDPSNLEICLKATRCALAMGTPEGFETADEYLQNLICLDPFFHDAYAVWRDTVLAKENGGLRRVSECLEQYIKDHRGADSLWLDIAGFRYRCDEIDLSLEGLKKLGRVAPEFRPVERHLLSARCRVELGELDRFQAAYDSALAAAELNGEFNILISQASAIFRPEEQAKADTLTTAGQWGDFFRVFWGRRDPDPLTQANERMFEHYKRLREAEKNYTIKNPYSKIWNSRNYYRQISLQTIGAVYEGNTTTYDYDPDLFFGRNRELMLEQRGLLYLRHGEPDEIERPGNEIVNPDTQMPRNDEEIWRYGSNYFVFSPGKMGPTSGFTGEAPSIGEYFFVPFTLRGSADINKAMETESFADMLPELKQDFYTVDFMAPGGMSEFETYQSVSSVEAGVKQPPLANLAVYNLAWREVGRDSSAAFETIFNGQPYWIGINRLQVEPGEKIFAARLDIPGRRAVQRHSIILSPFLRSGLELSGVVLGSPITPGQLSHSRLGVALLPRPSLEFTVGEMMTVYLEIYGLESGGYSERVTVTRVRETGVLGKLQNLLAAGGRERSSSLTLTFEREGVTRSAALPESFSVDTSLLLPGEYRMAIEVTDPGSGNSRKVGCTFKLQEPE